EWDRLPDEQKSEIQAAYQEISSTPGVSPGLQLQDPGSATTVRVDGGETLITDGPFAETKEALGGYLLFEADDLDAAIALAARIPAARLGGAIEVRPIVEW
ncbi:MAG TPA: YciI family protein, partial [Solirubrobacterales bacterium]|nr:YciI family protein [Solirubrobacterales bacterium]